MSLLTLVMLAAAELDNANLVALAMTLHRGNHFRCTHIGGTDGHRGSAAHQQHLIEYDAGTLVCVELLDTHHGTFLNAVLFTARGNHGIHCCNSESSPTGPQKSRELYGGEGFRSNRGDLHRFGGGRSPKWPAGAQIRPSGPRWHRPAPPQRRQS